MSNKYKILALDLDGTTLKSDNTLSPVVRSALLQVIDSGVEVVVASGRPFGSMHSSILEIEKLNYVIASNGATISDKDGNRFHSTLLSEGDVQNLLNITEPYDMVFEAFIDGRTYSDRRYLENPVKYGCSPAYIDYVKASHGAVDDMRSFIYENRNRLDCMQYVCVEKALREQVRAELENSDHHMHITSSSENYVEFMDENATKGKALEWLCNRLRVDQSEVVACGNADNDATMIRFAGLGAAVENASPLCRQYASLVVGSNDEDGVAELIKTVFEL